jgi:hypothetical protein
VVVAHYGDYEMVTRPISFVEREDTRGFGWSSGSRLFSFLQVGQDRTIPIGGLQDFYSLLLGLKDDLMRIFW